MAKSAPPTTTSVDKASQAARMLRIETVLDNDSTEKGFLGDPLLLTKFDGEEGISIPYDYNIVMYRSTAKNKQHPITADMLIGTKALVHCRGRDQNCEELDLKLTRMGIFITFEQLESDNFEDYVKFSAKLAPPFKLLDYESGFRVWEQTQLLTIIQQALITKSEFSGPLISEDTLDFSLIKDEENPKLEYCVQFGETTFNFISRLLKEYGIWYYFGHREKKGGGSGAPIINNEFMIFGRSAVQNFDNVKSSNFSGMRISKEPAAFDVDIPIIDPGGNKGWTVSAWRRTFIPAEFIGLDAGNFNQMDPSNPIDAQDRITTDRDLFSQTTQIAYDRERIKRQIFPSPAELNDREAAKGTAKEYEGEKQYVDIRIDDGAYKTRLISGISKNPTFMPGLEFRTDADLTDRGDDNKSYLISRVQISAFDLDYDFLTVGMLLEDVWEKSTAQLKGIDASTATVGQGLQEWMQNLIEKQISFSPGQLIFSTPESSFWLYNAAGALSFALTSAASTLGSNLLHDIFDDRSGYANNFVCVDRPGPEVDPGRRLIPLPIGTKPKAFGPHLALVIGPPGDFDKLFDPDELSTKHGDVFTDKFGRVRIRFPWDNKRFLLRPEISGSVAGVRPAAWVRVSEGWAGRQWGTQFLPRIGQEVIVEFLDGDPDRPIVTGRVYNSDHGPVNLPFPPHQRTDEILKLDDWLKPEGTTQNRYSGIKTSTIPVVDSDGKPLPVGFHLLRFDDTRGEEQYLVRSQRRLDITALQKRYESIRSDRHLTVGGKCKPKNTIEGDYIAKIFRHYNLHVGDPEFPTLSGNRKTLIEQDDNIQVKGSSGQSIGGNWSLTVGGGTKPGGGKVSIDALGPTGTVAVNANLNITLTVGSSAIVLTPVGISITSPSINLVSPVPVLGPAPELALNPTQFPAELTDDAAAVNPTPPIPADAGDSLIPPKED